MNHEEARALVQRVLDALIDPSVSAEEVGAYMSRDYRQESDGVILDRRGFIEHARRLKSTLREGRAVIDKIFVDGSTVVSVHRVRATKNDGSTVQIKVIACFETKDGKVVSTDELSHLIEGSSSDRDLSSRV